MGAVTNRGKKITGLRREIGRVRNVAISYDDLGVVGNEYNVIDVIDEFYESYSLNQYSDINRMITQALLAELEENK